MYFRNWIQKNILVILFKNSLLVKKYMHKKTSEYKDATLGKLPNQFRTNFKNFFHCAPLSKGPRNLLRKTCKGWGPIINPRSSFVDPSVLRFNARFTRGKSHWVEFISETNLPIAIHQVAIHLHLCFFNFKVLVKSNSSECFSMGAVGAQTRRSS